MKIKIEKVYHFFNANKDFIKDYCNYQSLIQFVINIFQIIWGCFLTQYGFTIKPLIQYFFNIIYHAFVVFKESGKLNIWINIVYQYLLTILLNIGKYCLPMFTNVFQIMKYTASKSLFKIKTIESEETIVSEETKKHDLPTKINTECKL